MRPMMTAIRVAAIATLLLAATNVRPVRADLSDETADRVAAATVLIAALVVEQKDGVTTGERDPVPLGSGTVINADGFVLTNGHVVLDQVAKLQGRLDDEMASDGLDVSLVIEKQFLIYTVDGLGKTPRRSYTADVVKQNADPGVDLAVLRIVGDDQGNPLAGPLGDRQAHLDLGDSNAVRQRDRVYIFGYGTFGDEPPQPIGATTIGYAEGVVSLLPRGAGLGNKYEEIDVDSTVGAGHSGGAAVNEAGQLIGIPTSVRTGTGGSLVVLTPINKAKAFLQGVPDYKTPTPAPTSIPTATSAPPATQMNTPTSTATRTANLTPTSAPGGTPGGTPIVLNGHAGEVFSVAFSPDGATLAAGNENGTVLLWDVATGQPRGAPLTGHTNWVTSVAFSPDGTRLASGSDDHKIILWDVATGQQLGSLLTTYAASVVFSPDGATLASSGAGTVVLWDVATGQPRGAPLTGHSDAVGSVAFSPDGTLLASGSYDATIILWDVATGQPRGAPLTGHSDAVNSVAFSPDGKTLASGSDDQTVVLWDVATGQPRGAPLAGHSDVVETVAFSPDGQTLAAGVLDLTIILWDVASGQPRGAPLTGHTDLVWQVAFSPDGTLLASGSSDGTVRLWNVAN